MKDQVAETEAGAQIARSVEAEWVPVCALEHIVPDAGICALVDGRQVAVFLLRDGSLHAVDNVDPFTGAAVLSRGIVGDRAGTAKVASPLHKQSFALDTGRCLDDESVAIAVHRVRVRDGQVEVALAPSQFALAPDHVPPGQVLPDQVASAAGSAAVAGSSTSSR